MWEKILLFFEKLKNIWAQTQPLWRGFILTSVVLMSFCICSFCFLYFRSSNLSQDTIIYIEKGTSVTKIYNDLEDNQIIRDSLLSKSLFRFLALIKNIHAGEYLIPAHASLYRVLQIFGSAQFYERRFTVPEGQTVWKVFDRLRNDEYLTGDLPEELPPEGSIMTDTVRYFRGSSRISILNYLLNGQRKRIARIWENRDPDLPLQTINQFVTLASIVEKETGRANERSEVAAVFLNRLQHKMRLQADSTVLYGLFGGEGRPADRPIYKSDLKNKNPYNTYVISGLPPYPICNPGLASLQAVAHPAKTKDLFFVADGTGGHVFSSNLEDHNVNVQRWRKIQNEMKKISKDMIDTN